VSGGPFLRRTLGAIADGFVTSPAFRWTWSAPDNKSVKHKLLEIRPSDAFNVADMMIGQYLLAQRLVDTGGTTPFAIDYASDEWFDELHSFTWLRHFSAVQDEGSKKFAGTLAMDWVSRYGSFSKRVWDNKLTALRVLNWIKHFDQLCFGLNDARKKIVERSLAEQVQCLRIRINFEADPARRFLMRLALLGSAIALQSSKDEINSLLERTILTLSRQIDENGMHRSRNGELQFMLLLEMIPVRHAVSPISPEAGRKFAAVLDKMHHSLALLMHTTGELSFFNNARSVPHEMLLAVQSRANSNLEIKRGEVNAGYAALVGQDSKLIVDGGAEMGEDFRTGLFAGATSFEYSFRNDLIVSNCGPGPSTLGEDADLFRLPASHSTLEIEYRGKYPFKAQNLMSAHMRANRNAAPKIDLDERRVDLTNSGYQRLAGVTHERSLNILPREGDALLGQDIIRCDLNHKSAPDQFLLRFHLGPGIEAVLDDSLNQIELQLRSGSTWAFIWEGADAMIEESVRYSAHKGLEPIRQIVLSGNISAHQEVVWTFMPRA